MASIGTPSSFSQLGSIVGHWDAGQQNLEFGWEDGSSEAEKSLIENYYV